MSEKTKENRPANRSAAAAATDAGRSILRRIRRYSLILATAWSVIIGVLVVWSVSTESAMVREMVFSEARAHFNKDQAFRQWAISHERIYVPVTETTQPDPYLAHIVDRDIRTPSGIELTVINPAAIVKDMNDRFGHLYGVPGRVTSLTPLRPENVPDPWERKALKAFENGVSEYTEFTDIDGEPYLRLMRPMMVNESCAECHTNFEVGQVGGGVGVAVPMLPHLQRQRQSTIDKLFSYGLLWITGLLGIRYGASRLRHHESNRLAAEHDLAASEALNASVLESALDCIITVDHEGRVMEFNPAAEKTFGYPAGEVIGRDLADLVIPARLRERHRAGLRRSVETGDSARLGMRIETTAMRCDGSEFRAELAIARIQQGSHPVFTAYLRDITERVRAEEALRESEERYALAAKGANDALWDWNLKTDQMYYSPRWMEILGCAGGTLPDTPEGWFTRVHPDDIGSLRAALDAHIEGLHNHFEHEHRLWHEGGMYRWVLARGAVVREAGMPYRIAGSLTDITESKVAEEQLRYDALHDALTGLFNRALFLDRLGHAIGRCKRRGSPFAVLFMDLDRFKLINDSLGHLVGDELLVEVAKRLEQCVRAEDTLARVGGDEFVILVEELAAHEELEQLAGRIQDALGEPMLLQEQEIRVSASIGIAHSDADYSAAEEVLRDADIAMYAAKLGGKGRHALFDPSMHSEVVAQFNMEGDLRRAIEHDEFYLVYQPIVRIGSRRIVGFEALLRWNHPAHGVIPPGRFIPIAEETGLIVPIGRWVLEEACRQLALWRDTFDPRLSVSVNVSGRQLNETDLAQDVAAILDRNGLDAGALRLELTETLFIDASDEIEARLAALKETGARLCIDDFGTGYSAMSYLHRFPADTLKIDRSFVARLGNGGRATVQAIIDLARGLEMELVAEGVETEAQRRELIEMGCTQGQGYLFARPLRPVDAETELEHQGHDPRGRIQGI